MLQSVGMTGRQVKQMLIYEGIGYSILGLLGSLILSVIASLTVVRMMGADTSLIQSSNARPSTELSRIIRYYYYPSDPHYSHCSFGLL